MEPIIIEYKIAINDGPNKGKTIDFTANMDDLELDSLSSLLIEAGHIESWCNSGEFHVVSRKINTLNTKALKRTLARAFILIEDKVKDELGIRVDLGTVFNKSQVLKELKDRLIELDSYPSVEQAS